MCPGLALPAAYCLEFHSMSKISGPRPSIDTSADGIHDIGGMTVIPWALANRAEPVTASCVSEKLRMLPLARIKSAGVRAMTAGTFERVTIAVLAAQQVCSVG
jgi:hypothetical protein